MRQKQVERARIIRELCDGLKADLLSRLLEFPDNWDGIELREYFAETARRYANPANMDRARMKQYRNDVLTLNL